MDECSLAPVSVPSINYSLSSHTSLSSAAHHSVPYSSHGSGRTQVLLTLFSGVCQKSKYPPALHLKFPTLFHVNASQPLVHVSTIARFVLRRNT
jgi:hypothetical protein